MIILIHKGNIVTNESLIIRLSFIGYKANIISTGDNHKYARHYHIYDESKATILRTTNEYVFRKKAFIKKT